MPVRVAFMASSSSSSCFKILFLLSILTATLALNSSSPSSSSSKTNELQLSPAIVSICSQTPYPKRCIESSKLSISIGLSPSPLSIGIQSLQHAFSEGSRLLGSIFRLGMSSGIVEKQRGTIQDCQELHQLTLKHIKNSITESNKKSANAHNVQAFLSAALTNKDTCFEGLNSAIGGYKPVFMGSLESFYQLVSNSLASFSTADCKNCHLGRRRLLHFSGEKHDGFPTWLSHKDRRLLQTDVGGGDQGRNVSNSILIVAQDGSENFTTISDAVAAAPEDATERVIIYVKQGVYDEHVDIPSNKPYIALLGDGIGRTIITGDRSVADGWTTYRSATVAVAGDGFLARDITFRNTAGAAKHQAVALRVNSDLSTVYRCSIEGYQDTLYAHSLRQFYRENVISGTVDFIFGNAAVVFQACKIEARRPMDGQFICITAQSRNDPNENTGISIQNSTISGDQDLMNNVNMFKSYLGRPWRPYSRTVYMDSYIDSLIDPAGWIKWSDNDTLDSLYYGEYDNHGPGSAIAGRVTWPGYHIMNSNDASYFTVPSLILGDQWLDSTSVPYDVGV